MPNSERKSIEIILFLLFLLSHFAQVTYYPALKNFFLPHHSIYYPKDDFAV
jgi:hypothetical protein